MNNCKSDEKWLVSVTAGRWQKHGIQEAKAIGLKVLAIDTDPEAEGFSIADRFLCISFDDPQAVINRIRSLSLNIAGVVSFCSEVGMMLAASIRQAFGLPGPDHQLTECLIDKAVQRNLWTKANVPGPNWKKFDTAGEAFIILKEWNTPFIIKPTDSSGSRGVTKVESQTDDLKKAIDNAFTFSRSGSIIAETFMEGTEFTVEVFAIAGDVEVLAITEKKKVAGTRGTVAKELATPQRDPGVLENLADAVVAAFKALGYTDGPGHAEAILKTDNSVGLVEVAGRGGGFMVFNRLVPSISGVNIARLTAMQAVGLPVSIKEKKSFASVLRFFPSSPGILESIIGIEDANKIEGVDAGAFVNIGQQFSKAIADGDRLGYILTSATTPQEAQRLADQAESLIQFKLSAFNDN
jgi:biotin carboxylase